MEILKWYSITLIGIASLCNLYLGIKGKDTSKLLAFLLFTPLLIYLIMR